MFHAEAQAFYSYGFLRKFLKALKQQALVVFSVRF